MPRSKSTNPLRLPPEPPLTPQVPTEPAQGAPAQALSSLPVPHVQRGHRPGGLHRYICAGVVGGLGATLAEMALFFAAQRDPLPPGLGQVAVATSAIYGLVGIVSAVGIWAGYWSALRAMESWTPQTLTGGELRTNLALRAGLAALCIVGLSLTLGQVLRVSTVVVAPIRRAAIMTAGAGVAAAVWVVLYQVLVSRSALVLRVFRRFAVALAWLAVADFLRTAVVAWQLTYDALPNLKLLAYGFVLPALGYTLLRKRVPERVLQVTAVLGTIAVVVPFVVGLPSEATYALLNARTQASLLQRELPQSLQRHAYPELDALVAKRFRLDGWPDEQPHLELASAPAGSVAAQPDVFLVTIDTLRADRFRRAGAFTEHMPNLARFAASATVFEHAFAASGATISSMSQLLTGAREHVLGHDPVPRGATTHLDPATATIARRLGRVGYRTEALIGGHLRSYFPSARIGFERARPFATEHPTAAMVIGGMLDFDKSDTAPQFRWAHLMDVHDFFAQGGDLRARYDEVVAQVDAELTPLLDYLQHTERGRRTLVVITSDHGEGLGEARLYAHGLCQPSIVAIPLVVRFPGAGAGEVRGETVGHLDIASTILHAAGVEPDELVGADLRVSGAVPERAAFFECAHYYNVPMPQSLGLVSYPWWFSYDVGSGLPVLIRLDADPLGLRNLAGTGAEVEGRLVEQLARSLGHSPG